MQFTKKEFQKINKKDYSNFILAGDIGGTNTNLGIFGVKDKVPSLLLSLHFKSKELKGLHEAINITLNYVEENFKIKVTKACFAVAGFLSPKNDYAKITNANWYVSKKALLHKTKLKKITLINDFEAIGYAINKLKNKDLIIIKNGIKVPKSRILVIGAGTGLGKTTLVYDTMQNLYIPLPSEAGHSDFTAQTQGELELVEFIKKYKKIKQSVSYEQVLSGQGLVNIYFFLRKIKKFPSTKITKEINAAKDPYLISKYRKIDPTCIATFKIFTKNYARFAKIFALDCLAFGGVYIAGGIAPKNKDIFDKEFAKEFENSYKMREVLKRIPIYLIKDYNVGLIGAGYVGARFL